MFFFAFLAWGLSRTWCEAADSYISMFHEYAEGKKKQMNTIDKLPSRPLACAIMAHPVFHLSTHGIKKTYKFKQAGNSMKEKIHRRFPQWNKEYIKAKGYPDELLRLVKNVTLPTLKSISYAEESQHYRSSETQNVFPTEVCNRKVGFGKGKDKMNAFAWV